MKITHNINRNMFKEYLPSKAALNLMGEKERSIRSEDQAWEENHPPRLTEICLREIVKNFGRNGIFKGLTCTDRNFVLEILPTNLPLPLVLEFLDDGIYWNRMVADRWKDRANHVEDYGFNWKRMYMERHVQELVESFSPEGFDSEAVEKLCNLASDYVYKLNLRQLKIVESRVPEEGEETAMLSQCFDHIDLSSIITGLKNLTELHIHFGVRHIGSNYKKSLFEISREDCKKIAEGITHGNHVRVLKIHQSALDDDKLISLLSNMTENKSLKKLEFPNCLISDDGVIALAKYLRGRKNIEELNLCNNKIGESGIEALSYVLTRSDSSPVKTLNLRFNAFGNSGFRFLASALIRENVKIQNLNVSCCNLNEESGILLGEMLKRNAVLTDMNLSSNHFGENVGLAIEAGIEFNKTLTFLDLRMTGIPNTSMMNISRYLHFNRIRARKGESGVKKEMQLMEQRLLEKQKQEKEEEVAKEAPEEITPVSLSEEGKVQAED